MTDQERIAHMLESIRKIQDIVGQSTKEEFMSSMVVQDAVLYNFAILGEAARGLSKTLHVANPDIPWGNIIGMRNFLIHEYVKTDLNFVWNAIVDKLPPLSQQLQKIQASL